MRSVVWRAGRGVRNRILLACGGLGHPAPPRAALVVVVAMAVVGCAPHYHEPGDFDAAGAAVPPKPRAKVKIPVPSRALLTPQAEPKCEDIKSAAGSGPPAKAELKRSANMQAADEVAKAAQSAGQSTAAAGSPPPGIGDADAGLALRIKLEYERECYRQAEQRARNRLHRLQESVSATVKAVETRKR